MTKGETLKLSVSDSSATSVEFRFGGPSQRTVVATKSDGTFSISSDTSGWAAGFYSWQAWATYEGGSKSVIASDTIQLDDVLGVGDVRSTARKIVENIELMLAGNASEGVRRYKINNRELERYGVDELLKLLSYWRHRLQTEDRKAKGLNGLGPRISIRF